MPSFGPGSHVVELRPGSEVYELHKLGYELHSTISQRCGCPSHPEGSAASEIAWGDICAVVGAGDCFHVSPPNRCFYKQTRYEGETTDIFGSKMPSEGSGSIIGRLHQPKRLIGKTCARCPEELLPATACSGTRIWLKKEGTGDNGTISGVHHWPTCSSGSRSGLSMAVQKGHMSHLNAMKPTWRLSLFSGIFAGQTASDSLALPPSVEPIELRGTITELAYLTDLTDEEKEMLENPT
jgi:hypothetical protein